MLAGSEAEPPQAINVLNRRKEMIAREKKDRQVMISMAACGGVCGLRVASTFLSFCFQEDEIGCGGWI
jgi:hypothetical protein